MGLLERLFGQTPSGAGSRAASYVVLDVETTGLSPRDDRILEIALVHLGEDGRALDEWATRIDPQGPVGATHIHGITQADVEGQPLFQALAPQVAHWIGDRPVVAHNATFDLAFLRGEFERAGWEMPTLASFCTLGGSYDYLPNLDRRRLADCCGAAGVRQEHAHSALGDARATAELFAVYLARDPHLARRVRSAGYKWPEGPSKPTTEWTPRPQQSGHVRFTPSRPAAPPLVKQLSALSLTEVIDEGAPVGSLAYLETLLTALEDGELSAAESQQLAALSYAYELSDSDLMTVHRAFMLALAHRALDDGHVSRSERQELHHLASALGVSGELVVDVIAHADEARSTRMGSGLDPLPADWAHGEPLRVGDKVVFTGCDDAQRTRLEKRAESLGVRVVGGVSRQTAMLVTDGGFHGTKSAKAAELSTRVVHPDLFEVLLDHLQPALAPTPAPPRVERSQVESSQVESSRPARPASGRQEPVASTQSGTRGAAPAAVRAWAIANGYDVGSRGRIHADVFDAYWLAQSAVDE